MSVITLLNLPINFLMEYYDGKYHQSIQMMTCHSNDEITVAHVRRRGENYICCSIFLIYNVNLSISIGVQEKIVFYW